MIPKDLTFASRFDHVTGSAIREIFKVLARPNMISFAGGNPSPDALPNEACADIAHDVLLSDGKRILQYGATEGYPPFLESLIAYLREQYSFEVSKETVLPTTGSTSGMDLICKAMLNPGDTVLVESPTFLGNMQTLNLYQAKLVPVQSDDGGVMLDKLEEAVIRFKPKLFYVIPTFQNPSGRTLALERRKPIADMAQKYGFLVVEDDPYRDLRYHGTALPPIKAFDPSGHVVYMGSFSKIISPGLRVGYLAAQADILRKCVIGKQGTDLHTPNLNQAIVDQFLRRGLLKPHIESIVPAYREKMEAMRDALRFFPKGTHYTVPEGGLFFFAELPECLNATELFEEAVQNGVAYVPGTHFYPEGGHHNTLRLNFSNSELSQITIGMQKLGELFEKHMKLS
ncbi:MAG: PLP-dependent aminotransferase family protein [Clostridia bacterium]